MAQWWYEWDLRILVIASLSAQYFLVLFTGVRKFHIPPWLRFSFRLAHIGSDALAIFALATLFNRQKSGPRCSYAPGSRDLELLWAPILLMHLGGQVVIITYKIEDNEQSTRYILTSLSKVTVALYVSYKTWSSDDKRLLVAMVLLFTLVIIRCIQKAMYLKSSSFNALRKSCSSEVNVVRGTNAREEERLDKFVQEAKDIMNSIESLRSPVSSPRLPHQLLEDIMNSVEPPGTPVPPSLPYQLFLDFPCSYSDRLTMVRNFRSLDQKSTFEAIEGALSAMTRFLYTKDNDRTRLREKIYLAFKNASAPVIFRMFTSVLAQATLLSANYLLVAHAASTAGTSIHKKVNLGSDARFTSVLLILTFVLEAFYGLIVLIFRHKFSGRILQCSLIGLIAHNKRHSALRSIAGWFWCKDLLDSFWSVEPSYSCDEITELVRLHVKQGWIEYIRDPYSYRMFNDTRGEWTLAKNGCLQQLGWSTRGPFDESIVLWHLATDLYIHHTSTSPRDNVSARQCKEMCNYMVHLLFHNPEMLMPGSRKRLWAMAYEELEVLLEGETTPLDEKELTHIVFEKCESAARLRQDTSSLIGDAWEVAQSLLSVDETKIWELIRGVWLEMLCFSAGRCRGYLHAEALATGAEYLSYVWVMLVHAGMETFPEKLQRREGQFFAFQSEDVESHTTARGQYNSTPSRFMGDARKGYVVEMGGNSEISVRKGKMKVYEEGSCDEESPRTRVGKLGHLPSQSGTDGGTNLVPCQSCQMFQEMSREMSRQSLSRPRFKQPIGMENPSEPLISELTNEELLSYLWVKWSDKQHESTENLQGLQHHGDRFAPVLESPPSPYLSGSRSLSEGTTESHGDDEAQHAQSLHILEIPSTSERYSDVEQ